MEKRLKEIKVNWLIRFVIFRGLWRLLFILPLRLIEGLSNFAVGRVKGQPGPQIYAAREKAILKEDYHFVVAGHTHHPATELIANKDGIDRYYIDTGTWRNQVPAKADFKTFGRLKALTYVVIYGLGEDLGTLTEDNKFASVDFWTGVTQRWEKPKL